MTKFEPKNMDIEQEQADHTREGRLLRISLVFPQFPQYLGLRCLNFFVSF